MKFSSFRIIPILSLTCIFLITSCSKDDDTPNDENSNVSPSLTIPTTYNFSRNGNSTVSYDGQTSRLNQLEEITIELKKADAGNLISSAKLLKMFSNDTTGGSAFSQPYTKQLKDKTFANDVSFFEGLMQEIASKSGQTDTAVDGTAGLMKRANGSTILVDANGREYTQLIEKGLMGATFYNQIVNTYLTADKIGPTVNNETLKDPSNGKYYTDMEHHLDEAFGYLGFPRDFKSNYSGNEIVRFWGKYSNTADDNIQSNSKIMNAFKTARAAIVAKNYSILDQEVDIIYEEIDRMIAATAIYYINKTIGESNQGERHHALSEAYAFIRALSYANIFKRKLSDLEVKELYETKIGNNFYNTTVSDLNFIKDKLSFTYGLESVKDQL